MQRMICRFALTLIVVSALTPKCAADDPSAAMLKRDGYTVSLDLKFGKKNQNALRSVISLLDYGPNAYATGFRVGDDLVMTAYHAVSGDLSPAKKVQLGFGAKDQLEVKAYVDGCQAALVKFDADADLALLRVCNSQRHTKAPAFPEAGPGQDEKLLVIARPNGAKSVRRGVYSGPYVIRGHEFWSAKIEGRDGYSGSPVYNERAELVGVFSGYDWSQKVAVISPGVRAQKLLEDYASDLKH